MFCEQGVPQVAWGTGMKSTITALRPHPARERPCRGPRGPLSPPQTPSGKTSKGYGVISHPSAHRRGRGDPLEGTLQDPIPPKPKTVDIGPRCACRDPQLRPRNCRWVSHTVGGPLVTPDTHTSRTPTPRARGPSVSCSGKNPPVYPASRTASSTAFAHGDCDRALIEIGAHRRSHGD
jgi:hypothetical protein